MQNIPNKPRHGSNSSASNPSWDIGIDAQTRIKDTIGRANSANLLDLFKSYDIPIDGYVSKKCNCPLPGHSDNSPSFYYNSDNLTFFCYGCHRGGRAVRLVSLMDGISDLEAAERIVRGYTTNPNASNSSKDYKERQKIILKFSSTIRDFLQHNSNDDGALVFAEKITFAFDALMAKHKIHNDGINKTIEQLSRKLQEYKI